jgi:hypothetical protein
MADLTAAKRKKMPASEFALGKGHFPVNDKVHARLALSGASHSLAVGNITPEEAAKVRHRADAVLGETDSTYHGHAASK